MLDPDRHPNRDLFIVDVMDVVVRADMATMEHPFFTLSKQPDMRTLTYEHGPVTLSVTPSALGLPTIFDKDILIYCISHLMHAKNAGREIEPTVRLTAHDLLVVTNRPTNNLGYDRLGTGLRRLAGAVIETNVKTGDEVTTNGFGLIDEYEYNRKGSVFAERLRYLEIKLSDWLFRAIQACEVLPIHRDYFRLSSGIDRRVYELARKHCGCQPRWQVSAAVLQKKCGSTQLAKYFRAHLRAVAASNHLPDYTMEFSDEVVTFRPRAEFQIHAHAGLSLDRVDALLSRDVVETARAEARAKNRDFYALQREFADLIEKRGPPDNIDGAFLAFVRKKKRA